MGFAHYSRKTVLGGQLCVSWDDRGSCRAVIGGGIFRWVERPGVN